MADPLLQQLVDYLEKSGYQAAPSVRLILANGMIVQGTLVSPDQFIEETKRSGILPADFEPVLGEAERRSHIHLGDATIVTGSGQEIAYGPVRIPLDDVCGCCDRGVPPRPPGA